MDKVKIFVSDPALEDMDEIAIYIATQFSAPNTADNMLDAFYEAILSLAVMPKRHLLVRDDFLASLGYRLVPVKNYLVFYSIDDSLPDVCVVNIERVLFSGRNWKHILNPS
jgi:toxin ParE1/3/4